MKQNITFEQLAQLTEEQKEKLREWWEPGQGQVIYVQYGDGSGRETSLGEYWAVPDGITDDKNYRDSGCGCCSDSLDIADCLPLLSIGQMIELLAERLARITHIPKSPKYPARWHVIVYVDVYDNKVIPLREITAPNLADALWQAVKEVLA